MNPIQTVARLLFVCAPTFALVVSSSAEAREEVFGSRGLAMGQALRAVSQSNDGFYFNPAALVLSPRASLDLVYQFNLDAKLNAGNVSLLDNDEKPLPGGFAYTFVDSRFFADTLDENGSPLRVERRRTGHDLRFGLGYPIMPTLSAGLTVRYLKYDIEGTKGVNAATGDVGILFHPAGGFALAIVGHNVIDIGSGEAPIKLGVGAGYTFERLLTLSFDWVVDFKSARDPAHEFHVGLELVVASLIAFRGGFFDDQVFGQRHFSLGAAYVGPPDSRFGFAFALQQEIGHAANRSINFLIRILP
ncbi:MAG: hypothetical protein HYY84_12450 [Deltaproteobacteria bacterium]|nr:hypothetical protein [Deltaproteobacteria bacterium]